MEKTPKETLKAYVDSQKFNSTTEIMDAVRAVEQGHVEDTQPLHAPRGAI